MRNTIRVQGSAGFSLLEISMVLIIVGLLLAPALLFSPRLIDAWKADLTRARSERVMAAYASFLQKNNRLPCVAWPKIDANNPILGGERNLAAVSNWQKGCQNKQGVSESWASGFNTGIVPFRALGIPEDYIFDGWGRPFQVRADPKSALPVDNTNTWALYNDAPEIGYSNGGPQIPTGCATADWWNMNYPDADRTIYDMDGLDNAGNPSPWRGTTYSDPANDAANPNRRRLSHVNMPKGRLCCGAGWTRDHIARYEGNINAFPLFGHDLAWERYELGTPTSLNGTFHSQHDNFGNIYDWWGMWGGPDNGLIQAQIGGDDTTSIKFAAWYQNNRVGLGNWFWNGHTISYGPAQGDQPIYNSEPLAVTLISAGPNGAGWQVFDYDGSGNCGSNKCDIRKPAVSSSVETANGIFWGGSSYHGWGESSNAGIAVLRHPFDDSVMPGENVPLDDLVFYAKTDTLMSTIGRGTCARP